jgi:outer membrane biosynthesis protein TonB
LLLFFSFMSTRSSLSSSSNGRRREPEGFKAPAALIYAQYNNNNHDAGAAAAAVDLEPHFGYTETTRTSRRSFLLYDAYAYRQRLDDEDDDEDYEDEEDDGEVINNNNSFYPTNDDDHPPAAFVWNDGASLTDDGIGTAVAVVFDNPEPPEEPQEPQEPPSPVHDPQQKMTTRLREEEDAPAVVAPPRCQPQPPDDGQKAAAATANNYDDQKQQQRPPHDDSIVFAVLSAVAARQQQSPAVTVRRTSSNRSRSSRSRSALAAGTGRGATTMTTQVVAAVDDDPVVSATTPSQVFSSYYPSPANNNDNGHHDASSSSSVRDYTAIIGFADGGGGVAVSSSDNDEAPLNGAGQKKKKNKKEYNDNKSMVQWLWIAVIAFLAVVGAIGIVVAIAKSSQGDDADDANATTAVFTQIGGDIVPPSNNNDDGLPQHPAFFGSDVAVSSDGNRIVVTYARVGQPSSSWRQMGQTIDVLTTADEDDDKINNGPPKILDQGLISIAMASHGTIIAVGHGAASNATGEVKVYHLAGNTWVGLGPTLVGNGPGDLFGTSVDLGNDNPIVIAVGAPGDNRGAGSIQVYIYDAAEDMWKTRGGRIEGEVSRTVQGLGGSVALSMAGTRVAAAGRSIPDPGTLLRSAVVRTFDYQDNDNRWEALDAGFIPPGELLSSTGWTVDLSADGNRMVISNSYLTEEDYVNTDPEGLSVRVLAYTNGVWNAYGDNLHAGINGTKSGYVVALSDDGSAIGMGDPGTSSAGRNVNGHAHVYRDQGEGAFVQLGPNLLGDSHADSFGFSVALSGDARRFVVGIPLSRAVGDNAGLVRVYETTLNGRR